MGSSGKCKRFAERTGPDVEGVHGLIAGPGKLASLLCQKPESGKLGARLGDSMDPRKKIQALFMAGLFTLLDWS